MCGTWLSGSSWSEDEGTFACYNCRDGWSQMAKCCALQGAAKANELTVTGQTGQKGRKARASITDWE